MDGTTNGSKTFLSSSYSHSPPVPDCARCATSGGRSPWKMSTIEKVSGSGRHIWHKWHKSLPEIPVFAPMLSLNRIQRRKRANSSPAPDSIDLAQPGPVVTPLSWMAVANLSRGTKSPPLSRPDDRYAAERSDWISRSIKVPLIAHSSPGNRPTTLAPPPRTRPPRCGARSPSRGRFSIAASMPAASNDHRRLSRQWGDGFTGSRCCPGALTATGAATGAGSPGTKSPSLYRPAALLSSERP